MMVDIETAGTSPGSAILSIGAVDFGSKYEKDFTSMYKEDATRHFFRAIDLWSSLMSGLTVDQGTLDWWRKQEKKARDMAQPDGRVTLVAALEAFEGYLGGKVARNVRLWAKGPDFDIVMIHAAYRAVGRDIPWSYRRVRDVRTIVALAGGRVRERDPKKVGMVEHNPVDDALLQAEAVREAYAVLGVDMDHDYDKDDVDAAVIQDAAEAARSLAVGPSSTGGLLPR